MQQSTVGRTQHRAATRGEHTPRLAGDVFQGLTLYVTKSGFALALKIFFDAATQALLDDVIRVDKGTADFAGDLSSDC